MTIDVLLREAKSLDDLVEEVRLIYKLTYREGQILKFLLLGKPNSEIAFKLQIGETTVTSHIRNMGLKMNCSKRPEIVACAIIKN